MKTIEKTLSQPVNGHTVKTYALTPAQIHMHKQTYTHRHEKHMHTHTHTHLFKGGKVSLWKQEERF